MSIALSVNFISTSKQTEERFWRLQVIDIDPLVTVLDVDQFSGNIILHNFEFVGLCTLAPDRELVSRLLAIIKNDWRLLNLQLHFLDQKPVVDELVLAFVLILQILAIVFCRLGLLNQSQLHHVPF